MSKEITFMRKDLLETEEMEQAVSFLAPLFENQGALFKKMLESGTARLDGKSFTLIDNPERKKTYRIMGNCIGPVLYVRDILDA